MRACSWRRRSRSGWWSRTWCWAVSRSTAWVSGPPVATRRSVVVSFTAANRDEAVFPDPNAFELSRAPNPHLAFGHGPHFCLGAHLARLQMQALFAEVLARTAEISYAGEPAYLRSNFQGGVSGCPCAGAGVVDREHGLLTVTAESGAPASRGWSGVVTGRDLQHRGRRGASDVPVSYTHLTLPTKR